MANQITLIGGLVQKPELRMSKAGNAYMTLSIAQNEGYKDENDEWKNKKPIYWRVAVYGKQAENIARCDIPLGTELIIVGDLGIQENAEYTSKDGVTYPESVEPRIIVRHVGVNIGFGNKVTSERIGKTDPKPVAQQATKTVTEKAKPATSKQVAPKHDEDDLFGDMDELFGDDSATGDDDIFA